MKKFLIIIFLFPTALKSIAQNWINVGTQGFSQGAVVYNTSMVFYNNTPYVAYQDVGNSGAATVMKYNGSNWVTVGNAGFTAGNIGLLAMAISNNGIPFVVYSDEINGEATVKKFNGSSWVLVGTAQFSQSSAHSPSIAIDNSGTPYVSFTDYFNNNKLSVMKFDGTDWVYVGGAGISITGQAYTSSIKISSTGVPYVAYQNGSATGMPSLIKYDGSSWMFVGSQFFTSSTGTSTQLILDSNDVPYVAIANDNSYNIPKLWKYNNNSWSELGASGFSGIGDAYYPRFALSNTGVPFIGFMNSFLPDHNISVVKFDGSNWVYIGNTDVSDGYVISGSSGIISLSIAVNNSGIPFVAYGDNANGNNGKVTVKKFNPATSTICNINAIETNLNLFPNPAKDVMNIEFNAAQEENFTLKVYDALGKKVLQQNGNAIHGNNETAIDLSRMAPGLYMLHMDGKNINYNTRFVVE